MSEYINPCLENFNGACCRNGVVIPMTPKKYDFFMKAAAEKGIVLQPAHAKSFLGALAHVTGISLLQKLDWIISKPDGIRIPENTDCPFLESGLCSLVGTKLEWLRPEGCYLLEPGDSHCTRGRRKAGLNPLVQLDDIDIIS